MAVEAYYSEKIAWYPSVRPNRAWRGMYPCSLPDQNIIKQWLTRFASRNGRVLSEPSIRIAIGKRGGRRSTLVVTASAFMVGRSTSESVKQVLRTVEPQYVVYISVINDINSKLA